MDKKIIKVLATGGTISTTYNPQAEGYTPALNGQKLVTSASSFGTGNDIRVEVEDVFSICSSYMDPSMMFQLAKKVRELVKDEKISGVVITHGTATLEETAHLLDLCVDTPKPIVLTGAQRSASTADSDGPRNLAESIRVAADPRSRNKGVLVVFNSEIHAARDVTKTHSYAVEAFKSGGHGYLGVVYPDQILYYRELISSPKYAIERINPNVDLIKFAAGMDARFIYTSIAQAVRGIVIEGCGLGNVNNYFYEGIKRALQQDIVVAVTTRCHEGRVVPMYAFPGGGVSLAKQGAVFLGDLNGPKARILLMVLFGMTDDPNKVKDLCIKHFI